MIRFFKSSSNLWFMLLILVFSKIISYTYLRFMHEGQLFGGGNDANYYHAYAFREVDNAVNFWPVILRFLNDVGVYNRDILSCFLFLITISIMPLLTYRIARVKGADWGIIKPASLFLMAFYPTIFFFSLDVYRDVFMVFLFLLAIYFYKKTIDTLILNRFAFSIFFMLIVYFLFLLRPYLGVALGLSPLIYFVFFNTRTKVKTWIFIYLLGLIFAKTTGFLNPILNYRGDEGFSDGASTLGLGLIEANPLTFIFYYLYSLFAQLFGLFFVNANSLIVFAFESIPFIFAIKYILVNIKYANKFVCFMLVFFLLYTTVWVLGNDNLGTAVRLRIPSYLAVFISMFVIYQEKSKSINYQ